MEGLVGHFSLDQFSDLPAFAKRPLPLKLKEVL